MITSDKWTEYELLDAADGKKVEKWGSVIVVGI